MKRTYQASNLYDEFENKRKCDEGRKEKREISLSSSLSLCVSLCLSDTHTHTPITFSFCLRILRLLWVLC